jgi:MoaA/NifB/PqqE/SkfB family radical SAM enzyme
MEAPRAVRTSSMCHVCFAEIPAVVERRADNTLSMTKTCRAHGTTVAIVERDADFCQESARYIGRQRVNSHVVVVEVTNRCNNRCPNCYHAEDRGIPEPTLDEIVGRVISIPTTHICLAGGEPTLRSDLPEIVRLAAAEGRAVTMYTNGIRLAEPGYANTLADAGLNWIGFSLHHPEYSHPSIYRKKLLALDELAASRLRIGHIAFSLQHEGQIPDILDFIERNWHRSDHFRIRSAYEPEQVPWFVSDLYHLVEAEARRRGTTFEFLPECANSRYAVGFLYGGKPLWLMSWPSNIAIDLRHARGYPRAYFLDGVEANFCRAVCIQNGLRRGWFAGRRIERRPWEQEAPAAAPARESRREAEPAA